MKKRLFISIPIPQSMSDVFANYKKNINIQNDINWTKKDNLHVTLLFLGDIEQEAIAKLVENLEAISNSFKPFYLKFDQFMWAPSVDFPRMIWGKFASSENYSKLVDLTTKSLKQFFGINAKNENNNLVPHVEHVAHVTLARIKDFNKLKPMPLKQEKVEDLFVCEFNLVESELGSDGPSYTIISHFSF
jgi:RNA 2',3'-cyclic 3'-phosphodiesterase